MAAISRYWGIDEHASLFFVPSILVGGLLLGVRGVLGVTIIGAGAVGLDLAFGPAQWVSSRPPERLERGQDLVLGLALIGVLTSVLVRHYRAFMDAAWERQQELTAALERLAAAEADRTRALVHAETANLAKSTFLANMSHELRTPLNAIIGFTELLQEDATPDQQPDLARVGGAGRHLLALIDDVLDVSRVEAGRLDVSLGRVDARAILADVLAVLAPALDAGGVAVTVDASPAWVSADHTRLRQVLTNLLSNACKFAESEIVVRVASEARQVVIHVDDDGAGSCRS